MDVTGDLQRAVDRAHHQLDRELIRKEEQGSQKYGEWAFLANPTIEMAMDEIVDWINYMRFTYAKLYIMNELLQAKQAQRPFIDEGFVPTSQLFGN